MDEQQSEQGGDQHQDDLSAELERLRAERDEARAQLQRLEQQRPSRHRVRRVAAGVLVVISVLSFLTGGVGVWASRNFLDTDVWVERVGPLADDPAVQSSLSDWITTETMQLVDPQALFEEVLPERGQLLAVPLSGAVERFVGEQVDTVVASDAFAQLWVGLNRQAHQAAVKVIRGDSEAIQAGDDSVTINLVPVINDVLAQITSVSPEIFGRTVDIPDVQIDEVPAAAIDRINSAFGTDLPEDFGQFTVYDQGALKEVQDAVTLFDRIVWISVIVFVLSTVGAFALSVDRRRTFLELAVADVVVLILLRRAAITAQDQVLDLVRVPDNVPAVRAVTDALLQGLFDSTRVLLWLFAIAIAIVWVTGRSAAATAVRRRTAAVFETATDVARARSEDPATAAWVVAHRDLLRVAGVVVALVALWWVDLGWLGVLVVLVLLAGFQLALGRVPERLDEPLDPDDADPHDDAAAGGAVDPVEQPAG